jgi:hypothetical protein
MKGFIIYKANGNKICKFYEKTEQTEKIAKLL